MRHGKSGIWAFILALSCGGSVEIADETEAIAASGAPTPTQLPSECTPCEGDCELCDTAERTYRCSASDAVMPARCWSDGSVFHDEDGSFVCLYCEF